MFWTLELASSLDDAPWPATKEELIDYATRTCAPDEVIENLEELDDDNAEIYESIEDMTEIQRINSDGCHFSEWCPSSFYRILSHPVETKVNTILNTKLNTIL